MIKSTTYSKNQANKAKILLFSNFSYVEYTCTNGIYIKRIVNQTFQCSLVWISLTQIKIPASKKNYQNQHPQILQIFKGCLQMNPKNQCSPYLALPSTITIILQKFSTPWHHHSLNNSTLNLRHRHATKIFLRLSSYPHYFLNLYYACVTTNKETFAQWKIQSQ